MVIIYQENTTDGDDWDIGCYEDILKKYRHEDVTDNPPMHPVDLLSIALQCDVIPVKDLNKTEGRHEGAWHLFGRS